MNGPDVLRLIDECPTVIGMMTTAVESGGSLDTAIRSVAEYGPRLSRDLFLRAVRRTDTKGACDLGEALSAEVDRLPQQASGYRNAVLLCIAASDSDSSGERLRLLREASDVALDSVKAMGERYSSSLTVPCMTVFGLGIMVPMILMSVIPMLGIGGLFGSVSIDSGLVVLITLVLIPAVILAVTLWIRRGNPFISGEGGTDGVRNLAPLLLAAPLAILQLHLGRSVEETVLLSVGPAAVVALVLMVQDRRAERRRLECERGLRDSVFELGNRLLGGEGFETVCAETIGARRECEETGMRLDREISLCRGDVESALWRAVGSVSPDVARAFGDILRCSRRDAADAGRLAMALGRQFHNSDNVRRELEMRLKSMKDMMTGTAVLFAPMVLGMSVSMLGPLTEIAGYEMTGDTGAVLSVYLVELCALIAILTSNLGGGDGISTAVWRFCAMAPLALVVFRLCSGLSL